jgi:uncharacterized protein (TIRG00374 family)
MNRKNLVRWAFIFVLTAVFVYFFAKKIEWNKVFASLTEVDPWLFAAIVLLAPLHLFTRALRWRFLIKPEKADPRFYNLFAANAVGFTVTLLLPGRLGEIAKPLYLAKKENIRKGFALGTVVVERIFDMLTMCALLGIFLVVQPLFPSVRIDAGTLRILRFWGIIGVAFALSLLLIVLGLHFFRDKTVRFLNFFLKPLPAKWRAKIDALMEEFIEGLRFFHSLRNLLTIIALSFVVWLGFVFYYWVFTRAYGVAIPLFFTIPYVFLNMVGASIPTPGMVGGFDYFSQLGLTALYGLAATKAGMMTLVVHAVQLIMTCLIGYAILVKERVSLFQLRKLGEPETETEAVEE